MVKSRKRKNRIQVGDEEPSSTKAYSSSKKTVNCLEDHPKEKRGRKRKNILRDDFTKEDVYAKTYNYVSKQNSYKQIPNKSAQSAHVGNDQVPLSINFSNREDVFNALPSISKADEVYQNPFRREWDSQSSWSENKYFFQSPVGLKTSHSFKEVRNGILDIQKNDNEPVEEKVNLFYHLQFSLVKFS